MCGIVGYVGPDEALPIVLEGLRRLEYRGYDSAGVAVQDGDLTVVKRAGDLALVRATAARAVRHQIRAHFASIGHPLIGDALYGEASPAIARHALHASRVVFDGGRIKLGSRCGLALREVAFLEAAPRSSCSLRLSSKEWLSRLQV